MEERPICPAYFHISEDIYECVNLVIRSVLGLGLSGGVVLAQSTISPEYMIALKAISVADRSTYRKKKELFDRELWAMQRMNHPHLMKGIYAAESPHTLYISMEYYPKGSLDRNLAELNCSQIERYLTQLASAVKHMHDMRIAHCDIKLPNILVESDEKIILTDFGLCLFLPVGQTTVPLKNIGGTTAYMAPERLSKQMELQIDPFKMDIYSLGVTLWGMAFRRNPEAAEYNYLEEATHSRDISTRLRVCLLSMLKINPSERFSSTELLEFLSTPSQ